MLKRFWHWLRNPEYPAVGVPYETVVALRDEAYRLGIEVGILQGRFALARALELMFPSGHSITAEDAANVKARQVH